MSCGETFDDCKEMMADALEAWLHAHICCNIPYNPPSNLSRTGGGSDLIVIITGHVSEKSMKEDAGSHAHAVMIKEDQAVTVPCTATKVLRKE